MVYSCKDCVLENIKYKHIDFTVEDENADINFNAIVNSPSENVEIRFEQLNSKEVEKMGSEDYESTFLFDKKKGLKIG